ncbi:MAG: basic secretory protein-like protein [Chthoniobacteraceae bacterium]
MSMLLHAGIAAWMSVSCVAAEKPLAALRLPLNPAVIAVPEVKLAFEGTPTSEVRAWADEAAKEVREWWPQVARLLATEHFVPPAALTLRFKPGLKAPAFRTTEGLTISTDWIAKHPDDFGMIIHEMTHAIQDYKGVPKDAGWLVEGIADYIRYWYYEPEVPHRRVDSAKASYRDGYSTTAAFLAWLIVKYDRRTVRQLDAALRAGKYSDAIFGQITGKALDPLWQEFAASLPKG